ncbi:MAG TPA: M3 family metallopeptidase [bacterium]|nr:M3 family metallopeptidase [bacterium]
MKEIAIAILCLTFCQSVAAAQENPLLKEFKTPFGVPPFSKIKNEHYLPAIKEGIRLHQQEIAAIVNNPQPPTFANTIDALELSGRVLTRVTNVFDNMTSALTSEALQKIAEEASPLRSSHGDDIRLNAKLFQRIKAVYEQKESLGLTAEQEMVLTRYYREFVRGGANLEGAQQEQLRAINQELALLTLKFGDHVLKETNDYSLVISRPDDLAGLPPAMVAAAAEAAEERGHSGKWVFTLQAPSIFPFLQYADNRPLRRQIYEAYIRRGDNDNEYDNKKILSKIAALRVRKANLLGYPSHADFVLEENMAKKPENVYALLDQLWRPAKERSRREVADMQAIIDREKGGFQLQPWDWWYYAEKVKREKYALDEEALRPYFKLENVRSGVFSVAQKLWGITFTERKDIPVYHPDVRAFEVKEADGRHIGLLFVDYFPRASKRGGAWMSEYRGQQKLGGRQTPVIVNVGNFSKPTADRPALLSLEEVETMFHEFGHALHGLLSDCTYPMIAGTSVARDFVELPSQIMENWAFEPQVLRSYAKHYQSGAAMPDELIAKIEQSGQFNQGFATVEYLAASYLDMDWHTLREPIEHDATLFEQQSLARIGLIPEIASRYRSPYFRHIFSGGYSSGYYAYIWAEVLDADAFQAFKENGLFDQTYAAAFRKHILGAGGSEEAMTLYKRFRGREPNIEPLLKKRGLM